MTTDGSVTTSFEEHEPIRIALAGQPNVGKSTLFNMLTGLSQRVGNWPGKTVERKEGIFTHNGTTYHIIDLPGTYSLTASSAEEVITREFIIRERPDIVVAMVDAALLERSLYLVSELLSLPAPVVVGLNMIDVAEQEGLHIEPEVLEAAMGTKVVPMIASKNVGVEPMLEAVEEVAEGDFEYAPRRPEIRADHQEVLTQIRGLIEGCVPAPYPEPWVALKLLEGDEAITEMMVQCLSEEQWHHVQEVLRAHDDALVAVASGRYEWIGRMVRAAVSRPKTGSVSLTERIDRWATHPIGGLLILAAILAIVFALTYTVGTPLQVFLDQYLIGGLSDVVDTWLVNAPFWLRGLLVDGVIGGVGFMLTFLPILVIFFAAMGILEDIGYMARAAYVMDGFMHMMGLHGKSFLPLFLGFGCNVPAVLGSRVIDSKRGRLLTILLAPLVPCTARIAIVAFLAPAFFGAYATLVSWGLVVLTLVVMAGSGMALNSTILRGERAAFIMELPLYHIPNWRTIGLLVWQRCREFAQKAGTVILPISLVVWALSVFPGGDVEGSVLATVGRWLEPFGAWAGLDWRLIVALMSSFVASENSLAALGVLFDVGQDERLASTLASAFSPAAGLSFLVIQMLFVPCVATMAAIKQETDSWAWTIFSILFMLTVALLAGGAIYWLARWGGLG